MHCFPATGEPTPSPQKGRPVPLPTRRQGSQSYYVHSMGQDPRPHPVIGRHIFMTVTPDSFLVSHSRPGSMFPSPIPSPRRVLPPPGTGSGCPSATRGTDRGPHCWPRVCPCVPWNSRRVQALFSFPISFWDFSSPLNPTHSYSAFFFLFHAVGVA